MDNWLISSDNHREAWSSMTEVLQRHPYKQIRRSQGSCNYLSSAGPNFGAKGTPL